MSEKILTAETSAQDLRDACVYIFGVMERDDIAEIMSRGVMVDLTGIRYPIARMAEAVAASGVVPVSDTPEFGYFGKWHRVANYICALISAQSGAVAISLGFDDRINSGNWLWAGVMESIHEQFWVSDGTEPEKFWIK